MEGGRQTGTRMGAGGGFWVSLQPGYPSRGQGSRAGVGGVRQKSLQLGSRRCWIREPRGDPLADYPAHCPLAPRSSIFRRRVQAGRLYWAWPLQTRSVWKAAVLGMQQAWGDIPGSQGVPQTGPRSCSPEWPGWRRMAWTRPLMLGSLRSKGWTPAPGLELRQREGQACPGTAFCPQF